MATCEAAEKVIDEVRLELKIRYEALNTMKESLFGKERKR
jgi:hypothetical protein